jgi:hypothetical protein
MVFARGDVSGHDDQTLGANEPCSIPRITSERHLYPTDTDTT